MTNHEQGRTDEVEEFGPVDPDIALITRWLAEELTPDEEAAVEARLEDDETFFDKVAPLMRIWTMPVRFGDLVADRAAESPYKPIEAQKGRVDGPAPASEAVPEGTAEGRDLRARPRRRPFLYAWRPRIAKRTAYWVAGIFGGLVIAVPVASHFAKVAREQQDLLRKQGVHTSAPPTPLNGIPFDTPKGPRRAVRFGDGSFVNLGPKSHFTYRIGPVGVGLWARLDGEATIEVSAADQYLLLKIGSATALLTTGTYAARCEKDCAEMRLAVGAGQASLRGADTAKVAIHKGEFGRVPRGGAAERSKGGAGYPAIVPRR